MLLRTEELGHVPLFQFKTPLQFKITARKLATFIFFLRLQVQEVFKPGSKCGEPSAMHNDNKLPQIMSWGLLNSHTGLGSLWPCQPSTWDDRGWRSMTACRFHVNVHTDDETEANTNMSCSNNTGHEIALEEVSFSPFLAKGNTSFQKKKKNQPKTLGWSTSGDDQHTARDREGVFLSQQLRADLDDFKHTLFCKRHSHIVCL